MTTARRAAILKLASAAYEMDLDVLSASWRQDKSHWLIGKQELLMVITPRRGVDLVLVLGSLERMRPVATRTCRTCAALYWS